MRTHIYQETINVFLNTLTGGFNHFSRIQGKFPYPGNKGKKCLRLLSVAVFFRIIRFGPFFFKASHQQNNVG